MTVIEVKLVSMSSHINLSGQYLPPAHLNGKYHRPLKQTIILDEPGAKINDDVMVGGSITEVLGILMWWRIIIAGEKSICHPWSSLCHPLYHY
jgi:hypothetical protein